MFILAETKNFTLAHNIYVIDGNNIVNTLKTSTKNLPELICELGDSCQCNNIKLKGNKNFNEKIKTRIESMFMAKYNTKCPFEIEFI